MSPLDRLLANSLNHWDERNAYWSKCLAEFKAEDMRDEFNEPSTGQVQVIRNVSFNANSI